MSIDLSRMPKIGFGLMRLPETDGVIDIDKVCKMADAYMEAAFARVQISAAPFLVGVVRGSTCGYRCP